MVICLLGLLAVAVIGLPLTVKGDGTAEGQLRITITYSLGAAFALLALASLWAGALSIAQEIEERQIQLLATKPVRRAEIWLGKWLGLMAVNTALLLVSALTTAVLLPREQLDAQSEDGPSWRAVHQSIAPASENYEQAAQALLAQRRESGEISTNVNDEIALRVLRQELLVRAATVAPAQQRDWTVSLPRAVRSNETIRLRFRYSSSIIGLDAVQGHWIVGTQDRPQAWQAVSTNAAELYQTIDVPATALAGARVLSLRFINEDPSNVTLVFNPQDGLRVLLPAGSFATNYARALLLLLMRLGFLTALGVTAGALFSSPVALFMAIALMFMAQLAGYTSEYESSYQRRVHAWIEMPSSALRTALKPLSSPPVLDAVATGLLVENAWLGRVAGIQLLLYGGALAIFGAGVLNRRELALPNT